MGFTFGLMAIAALLLTGVFVMLNASPAAIANTIRTTGPVLICALGLLLTITGRAGLGLPLLFTGAVWIAKNRSVRPLHGPDGASNATISTVRSAWLEMQLDHDSGDMDGIVLTGPMEGNVLSAMNDGALLTLYQQLSGDGESAALMEAYLDRRIAGWRENANPGSSAGQGQAPGLGPMTEQEAYQVLGLAAGASADEVRAAHRRLMKVVHPDGGGSTFLAARINEAKDTLLK